MGLTLEPESVRGFGRAAPRFGSYIGLFYVAAILAILGFAVFHDSGTGHAYDRLRPGMTPTEVAALLGVPGIETRSGTRSPCRSGGSRRLHDHGGLPGGQAALERALGTADVARKPESEDP